MDNNLSDSLGRNELYPRHIIYRAEQKRRGVNPLLYFLDIYPSYPLGYLISIRGLSLGFVIFTAIISL